MKSPTHDHETESTRILQKNVRKTDKKLVKQDNVTQKFENESYITKPF